MEDNPKILVIIPCYNESASIIKVINKLKADCPKADYVVINDCSTDNTLSILKENKAQYINFSANLGIGGGVQCGYKYARDNDYDIAIQIDGDGQHDTAYLEKVIEPLKSGRADIAIGSRFIEKEGFQSSAMRRMGINFLSDFIKLNCGTKISDVTSGFRAVNRNYIKLYADDYPTDYPEPVAIVQATMKGARIGEVPVVMKAREGGTSSIHAWKNLYYMIKVTLDIMLCRISNLK